MKNEWSNLTCIQVRALRECLDFLANGYYEHGSVCSSSYWVIILRHRIKKSTIKVFVHPWDFSIEHDGKEVKSAFAIPDKYRYDILIHSQIEITTMRTVPCVSSKLVSGSVLTNQDGK